MISTFQSRIEFSQIVSINISNNTYNRLKQGIWLYFWLLLFEGALRKWFLPQLAAPLLIIRDPVAIWLLIEAYKYRIVKNNIYLIGSTIITIVSFITTVLVGHGNLTVALYGARIMLIQFPLLFIIGQVFTYDDVLKIGKAFLWITPLMTILIAIQFYSPQSSWVNRGLGGDISGAGFSGAMGFYRPPGTFSFISGLAAYYGLVATYVFYFWLDDSDKSKKWLLILATISLLAAIPLSISRTLFFEVILTFLFTVVVSARKPKYFFRVILSILGLIMVFNILTSFGSLQTATEVFLSRFESASETEGGLTGTLGDRFLGGMFYAITDYSNQAAFWGQGLGMGTNAGAKIMTGSTAFLISEGEWGRLVGEMGFPLGLTLILIRIHLAYKISYAAYKSLLKENFLPWLLLSFAFINVLQGQWAQPTALGFAVFSGGLVVASLKRKSNRK